MSDVLRSRARPPFRELRAERSWRALSGALWGQAREPMRLGRYVLLDAIADGAGGSVFAGRDPELDRMVAIKVPHSAATDERERERLLGEAKLMAKVAHDNVVRVFDVGTCRLPWDGQLALYFVMEIVEGSTLTAWLAGRDARRMREVIDVFAAAGAGLAAAHRCGIVHRDFKPDNVLVGTDGRVCVTDFGLAELDRAGDGESRRAGTPMYMAPEQHEGHPATEHSDQFAFCVALHHALFGHWPHEGESAEVLAAAKAAGPVPVPASGHRVPTHVSRAIVRGLHPDPRRRHPSMETLLAALAARRWRTGAVVAAAGLGVLSAGVALSQPASPPACDWPVAAAQEIWNAQTRERVVAAFYETGVTYASTAAATATGDLDAYVQRWTGLRVEVCHAARGDRGPGHGACLDDRMREFAALVDGLAHVDRTNIARANRSVDTLGRLQPCYGDVAQRWEGREALYDRLARGLASRRLGDARGAETELAAVMQEARVAGDGRLVSEAALELAGTRRALGRPREALDLLSHAAAEADRVGVNLLRARAQVAAVSVAGYHLHDREAGLAWAKAAEATLHRLGAAPSLWAGLWMNLSNVAYAGGDWDTAEAHARRAVEAYRKDDAPLARVVMATNNLAVVLQAKGAYAEAAETQTWVFDQMSKLWGADHPTTAASVQNLALTQSKLGHQRQAEAGLRSALDVQLAAYGPTHPRVAITRSNLASVLIDGGQPQQGLEEARRALHDWTGPSHPALVMARSNIARAQLELGAVAEAEDAVASAWAMVPEVFEDDDPRRAELAVISGRIFESRGRLADARRMYRTALDLGEDEEARAGLDRTEHAG